MNAKRKSQIKLFEFYRVLDESLAGQPSKNQIVEPCDGKKRKATISGMTSVCSKAYGAGNYVALELPTHQTSLPLSYWIIKIRPDNKRAKMKIEITPDELNIARTSTFTFRPSQRKGDEKPKSVLVRDVKIFYEAFFPLMALMRAIEREGLKGPKTDIYSWQRGVEAALVAKYLSNLDEPTKPLRKSNQTAGRRRKEIVTFAVELQEDKTSTRDARLRKLRARLIEAGEPPEEIDILVAKYWSSASQRRRRAKRPARETKS